LTPKTLLSFSPDTTNHAVVQQGRPTIRVPHGKSSRLLAPNNFWSFYGACYFVLHFLTAVCKLNEGFFVVVSGVEFSFVRKWIKNDIRLFMPQFGVFE
jgi:hypothetical protein